MLYKIISGCIFKKPNCINSGLIYTKPSMFAGDGTAEDKCVNTNNNPLKNRNLFKPENSFNALCIGNRTSPINNALKSCPGICQIIA